MHFRYATDRKLNLMGLQSPKPSLFSRDAPIRDWPIVGAKQSADYRPIPINGFSLIPIVVTLRTAEFRGHKLVQDFPEVGACLSTGKQPDTGYAMASISGSLMVNSGIT